MMNRQFDEHIKNSFSDYKPEVPEYIWNNIIAEKDRRKPVGFWMNLNKSKAVLLLIGLAISGGLLTWQFSGLMKSGANKNSDTRLSEKQIGTNNVNEEDRKDNSEKTASLTGNVDRYSNEKTVLTNPAFNAATVKGNDEYEFNAVNKNNKVANKTKYSTSITNPAAYSDPSAENNTVPQILPIRLTYNFQLNNNSFNKEKWQKLQFKPLTFLPGCPGIEKDAAGNKKYLEFYAGPDIAIRSFSDTGNSVYLQRRKESTSLQYAYSAGLRYTKVFNNSMSVRGGINYSQVNEKFTYVQGNIVQVTYIIGVNGDTLGSYVTSGTRYKTTINKYRSIDIPLQVGYELGNGKLHANINAGAVVNLYSWQKGEVLDTALRPVSITTGKSNSPYQYKTNAGVGFIGAVSLYYRVGENVHLMAEPYLRYNLTPITSDRLTLKQKNQTAGLRVGIRLDLK